MLPELKEMLKRHEGIRLKPYLDCCGKPWRQCVCEKKGKLTIGIGRNLDDVGITEDEAEIILLNDIDRACFDLIHHLPWWKDLDKVRQMVMVNMCFNLGIFGLLTFKNTLAAIKAGDYAEASVLMLESKWASQVGPRAFELSEMMRMGEKK